MISQHSRGDNYSSFCSPYLEIKTCTLLINILNVRNKSLVFNRVDWHDECCMLDIGHHW